MFVRLFQTVIISMAVMILAACSPEFNWRALSVAEGQVSALFPDKPDTLEQTFSFAGHEIQFAVSAARAGGALFAVIYAPLPDALAASEVQRTEMGQVVLRSLYENLQLPIPEHLPDFGDVFTIEGVPAEGESKGQATALRARVWLHPHALVEGMVMGQADHFPAVEADEFLYSIKVGVR